MDGPLPFSRHPAAAPSDGWKSFSRCVLRPAVCVQLCRWINHRPDRPPPPAASPVLPDEWTARLNYVENLRPCFWPLFCSPGILQLLPSDGWKSFSRCVLWPALCVQLRRWINPCPDRPPSPAASPVLPDGWTACLNYVENLRPCFWPLFCSPGILQLLHQMDGRASPAASCGPLSLSCSADG